MKKYLIALIAIIIGTTVAWAGMQDRFSEIELVPRPNNYIRMPELSSAPSTPLSGWGKVYTKGNDIYFKDDAGVATSMIGAAAGGISNLDEAYDGGGAGAGATVAVDAGPVIFTGTHGTENTTELTASGTGNVIDITNTGSGKDIDGTGSTWHFTKLGALTLLSADAFTGLGDITMDDGVGASPQIIFKDATDETAAFDKTDSGALVLTTLAADGLQIDVGNLWVGNAAPGVASMDGEDAYIEGELEVDGAVQLDGAITATSTLDISGTITLQNDLVLDNAVNNTYAWTENSETVKWTFNSNDLAFADGGSGVVELSFLDGVADAKITHSADGADDDFYIQQTGAHDASLLIQSAGTGVDAITISASAGGMDIDAAAGNITIDAAATYDINVMATGGKISAVASEAAADQFKVDAQGTIAGDAINLETTDGGIMLNADGGANGDIELNAAHDLIFTAAGVLTVGVTGTTTVTNAATISGATTLGAAIIHSGIQDVPAGGTTTILALTNSVFTVGADAGGDIVTLANGTAGQIVYIICEDQAGTTTITPETFNGGTSITFNALGDAVTLVYTAGTGWSIVGGNSYTII
jgi:cytoskeletal protein CcmA (bactofilin family)